MRILLLIDVKNGFGLIDGDIGNALCTTPCAENSWYCCGAEFCPRCGEVVVIKCNLYGLNMSSK